MTAIRFGQQSSRTKSTQPSRVDFVGKNENGKRFEISIMVMQVVAVKMIALMTIAHMISGASVQGMFARAMMVMCRGQKPTTHHVGK